ncbi:MAG: exo-alpha-sialidase, partial [Deltaproteobacteria bacterium]|nr:exo-alpha-sialidase [Deltaproteobacteria bacterium]
MKMAEAALLPVALLGLASAGVAAAHEPHAITPVLMPPAALDDSAPWFAIVDARPAALARSDDGGRGWRLLSIPPAGDVIVTAARADSGRLYVVSQRYLWWTDDEIDWERVALPGTIASLVAAGDELFLGGESGIYDLESGEILGPVLAASVAELASGPRPAARFADGRVARLEAEGWVVFDAPEGASAVVDDGQHTFVGTRDGGSWRRDDGGAWVACGPFPIEAGPHPDVVALATDGTMLALATGEYAAFVSTDRCDTWFDQSAPLTMRYGSDGSAIEDPDAAVRSLHVSGDRLAWSGFYGAWFLGSAGAEWQQAHVLGADYTRGGAWLPGTPPAGLVLGFYAAGPSRTDDGGATWVDGNAGLFEANVQEVVADRLTGALLSVVGHENWASADGGASWTALPAELAMESFVAFDPVTPGRALAAGTGNGGWESLDGGRTWSAMTLGGSGGALRAHAAVGGHFECIGTAAPSSLQCRDTLDTEWRDAIDLGGAETVRLAANDRVALASIDSTLVRVEDTAVAATAVLDLDADRFALLASADDGALLAATHAGDLWVSHDDGEAWTCHPGAIPAPAKVLLPVPGADAGLEVALPTLGGVYLWREATGEISLLAPVERIDLSAPFWALARCGAPVGLAGAHMGGIQPLDEGCLATVQIRGEQLVLRGTSDGT